MDNMEKTPLDDLLNQSFLETDFDLPENQGMLDAVSETVLKDASLGLTKPSLFQQIKSLFNIKILSGIGFLAIFGVVAWMSISPIVKAKSANYQPRESGLITDDLKLEVETFDRQELIAPIDSKNFRLIATNKSTFSKPIYADLLLPELDETLPFIKLEEDTVVEPYRFPVLTPKQIAENKKRKENILKDLLKLDKDKYAAIPIENQIKNEYGYVMQRFHMRTTEVTNIEYKTFLFDILLQDRKQDFLIAKPKQDEWLNFDNKFKSQESLKNLYFSHPAYNDYPVVNISRAGAEMYCKWLSSLVAKSYKNKNRIETVRLPYSVEWDHAAAGGLTNSKYPWGGPYLRNSQGCFLANFHPMKENAAEDGGLFTVKADSYSPNNYGLYNMSGNVAEMVTYFQQDTFAGTKGGSFKDISANIQLNAPDLNKGVVSEKAYIGFRPVVITNDLLGRLVGTLGVNDKEIQLKEEIISERVRVVEFFVRYQTSFSLIKGGDFKWNKELKYVSPFFIQRTEVSNDEYRMFIDDLEERGKAVLKQKYLPDGKKWNTAPMEEYYFSHPAYGEYPVVNISRQAALAYCKWIEEEINEREQKIAKEKGIKPIQVQVDIPTEMEWYAAASNMGRYNNYPWHSYLRHRGKKHKGEFMANFRHTKEQSENIEAGALNDNADITAPVRSYWPNTIGIYNIGGNVAEMVQYANGSIGAKGGSWNQSDKYLKIHAEDPFIGIADPHNEIGFRPVIRIVY